MDPILGMFEGELRSLNFKSPQLRLISNLTGKLADSAHVRSPGYWRDHIRKPVRFSEGMSELAKLKCDAVIEIGPAPTLTALGQQCLGPEATTWCASLRRDRDDWHQLLDTLKTLHVLGVRIDWTAFEAGHLRRKLDLPTYPFQRERFWFKTRPGHEFERKDVDGGSAKQHMYIRQWDVQPLLATSEGKQQSAWIILADRGGTGAALAAALLARGDKCLIHRAEVDNSEEVTPFELRVLDHKKLCRKWHQEFSGGALGIIDLRWLDTVAWQDSDSTSLEAALECPVSNTLSLVQAILAEFADAPPRIWWVTRGAQAAGEKKAPLAAWQSAAWGLVSSVGVEHPELRPVCIDLSPEVDPDEIIALTSELEQDGYEDQVVLRTNQRLVPRLVRSAPSKDNSLSSRRPTIARPDGTYLITGGLTGLGLAAAQWLVGEGARHLALIGRRGVSEETSQVLSALRSTGVAITTAQLDIADSAATADFLEQIRKEDAPLRGIFHAAGIIDDGAVLAQDWARFRRVLRPKAGGVQVLDRLTRPDRLDWFVMFSSMASLVGSPGQANYCAANAILDCVTHERRRLGLPAQSINWGPWQQIGLAAGKALQRRVGAQGFSPMTPGEGVLALGEIMREGNVQVGAARADWSQLLARRSARGVPRFFSKLVDAPGSGTASTSAPRELRTSLQERLEGAVAGRRRAIVKHFVRECIMQVLADGTPMTFDDHQPLGDLGLNSLLAVELRNTLSRSLGVGLSPTLLFDYPTVDAVTDHLLNEVLAATKDSKSPRKTGSVGLGSAVLAGVSEIPEEEIDRLLAAGQ